jgi:hypothetical protein
MKTCGKLILTLIAALVPTTEVGHAFSRSCYEPAKPSCISMLGISRDEFSFNMCRDDVNRFRLDTEEYLACLDKKKNDAIDEFNKAVEEINCYAQGRTISTCQAFGPTTIKACRLR